MPHAILGTDDITGATTFRIVAELDAGPVFGTVTEAVRPSDTSGDLLERLASSGAELLVATLDGIEDGTLRAVPQPAEAASASRPSSPPRTRAWTGSCPPTSSIRVIRGCTPDPGAWTEFEGARMKLWPVTLARPARQARMMLLPGSRPGSCAWSVTRCTRVPAHSPSASATSSRRASGGCPPPPGRGACTPGRPTTPASADHGREATCPPRPRGGGRHAGDVVPRRGRPADLPRRTAYDVLAAVHEREAYANLLLPRLLAERSITGRDAALATELAYGTLRGLGTYDAVLAACSDRPLDKLDLPVLNVLRLGAHQLLATRVGAHAAVATSVDLVKAAAGPRVSGYVNAVLRRVATRNLDEWLAIVAPSPEADPDGYLAVRYSYPRWIVRAYRDALADAAEAELAAALAAGNERPRVTMAAFPAGPGRDAVLPDGAEPCRWSPFGFTLPGGRPRPA